MSTELRYVPILRGRQEEFKVLKSFDFGLEIYPCLEIIKELDRQPSKPKKDAKKPAKPKTPKKFEDVYLPLIEKIKAKRVFIDLPIHLATHRNMTKETLDFLQTVVGNRMARTAHLKKFSTLSNKVIPVISSLHARTGEPNTITLQADDLRPIFKVLAFRTLHYNFNNDILQIEPLLTKYDYLIIDWRDESLNSSDSEQSAIIRKLATLKCNIIVHRNAIPKDLTYTRLVHTKKIDQLDNSLLDKFQEFSGDCFSDYSGIKKDVIRKGGGKVNPGFIYFDAVSNEYYGYIGSKRELSEFKDTIVPSVISSAATKRMRNHRLDFLGSSNLGWKMILRIHNQEEPGRSAAKFKRIGIEHYLHSIKTRILNGDFN